MAVAPWIVSDGLRERMEPLLPKRQRRFCYPGRRPLPDREALEGILSVLHTGPGSRGGTYRSSSARRGLNLLPAHGRLAAGGVWKRLHTLLLAELRAAGALEWLRPLRRPGPGGLPGRAGRPANTPRCAVTDHPRRRFIR
jgi:transposase